MVSCQKGPTRHAYAWQIGPFWQDTIDISMEEENNIWGKHLGTYHICAPSAIIAMFIEYCFPCITKYFKEKLY